MKLKFLLLSVLLVAGMDTYSQAPNWMWTKNISAHPCNKMAIDRSGNILMTGWFTDTVDFDPGPGTFNLVGNNDVFISKLDSAGNFIWAKKIGSSGGEVGSALVTDDSGNVYTTGTFSGYVDFDPGAGSYVMDGGYNNRSIFILKLNSSGNFRWAKAIGQTGSIVCNSIGMDSLGNIYTTGEFTDTVDFDPGTGVFNIIADPTSSATDMFVSKIDKNGSFLWAKSFRPGHDCHSYSLVVDPSGDVTLTGTFKFDIDFDPDPVGTFYLTANFPNADIFTVKLNSAGNLVWANAIGGANDDDGRSIATDQAGNIFTMGGFTAPVDFDPGPGTFILYPAPQTRAIFVSKSDSAGHLIWAGAFPAAGTGNSLAVDSSGNVYVAGYYAYGDFDPDTINFHSLNSVGSLDIFVVKLNSAGKFCWVKSAGGLGVDQGFSLALSHSGKIYVGGNFAAPFAQFDSITLMCSDTTLGYYDMFISELGNCSAYYTVFPDTTPHNWNVINYASGIAPITYVWNWGDSTTSTGSNPSHTYSTAGYYNICLTVNDAAGCSSSYCDSSVYLFRSSNGMSMVTVNVINPYTGIAEPEWLAGSVKIYPNPSNGQFDLDVPLSVNAIQVFSAQGQLMQTINCSARASHQIGFSQPGIYFIRLTTAKNSITKKLIVID